MRMSEIFIKHQDLCTANSTYMYGKLEQYQNEYFKNHFSSFLNKRLGFIYNFDCFKLKVHVY